MKINIWKIPFGYHYSDKKEFAFSYAGYIEMENFDRDECWHLCNWSCWSDEKPDNLFSDLDVANSDVIYHNPTDNKYHLALPMGWHIEGSLSSMIDYLFAIKK